MNLDDLHDLLSECWRTQAACRDHPRDTFFPRPGETDHAAKLICSTCPVRPQCWEAGLRESSGVWGGVNRDPHIRRRENKQRGDEAGQQRRAYWADPEKERERRRNRYAANSEAEKERQRDYRARLRSDVAPLLEDDDMGCNEDDVAS